MGRPGGVELRVHILWPLLALSTALLVANTSVVDSTEALYALLVLFVSVTLHELTRAITASRVGGHPSSLVLGPIGGLTKLHLPVDPPAHLVTSLAGPMTHLVLLVVAGFGLALTEERDVMGVLLQPCSPHIFEGAFSDTAPLLLAAKLTVWINWCLLLISFLPVDPCDGAGLLRGTLWPMVGRSTATSVTSRVSLGSSLLLAALAVYVSTREDFSAALIPSWFPLSVIAVFMFYGGYRQIAMQRYDVGLAIDELDSDDEEWLLREWESEEREAVLVEHLQDKQQEAIDRKRREREANEDARVDDILLQLQNSSFDQLSEEDRATLKRASRRYRERRAEHSEGK